MIKTIFYIIKWIYIKLEKIKVLKLNISKYFF